LEGAGDLEDEGEEVEVGVPVGGMLGAGVEEGVGIAELVAVADGVPVGV
jgi:hypothetical protein